MSVHPHHFIKIIFLLNNFILIHHNQHNSITNKNFKDHGQISNWKHFAYFLKVNFQKNSHAEEAQ